MAIAAMSVKGFLIRGVPRRDIVLFQHLLEGYEGIFSVTTINPQEGIMRVEIMTGFEAEALQILAEVQQNIRFTQIAPVSEGT